MKRSLWQIWVLRTHLLSFRLPLLPFSGGGVLFKIRFDGIAVGVVGRLEAEDEILPLLISTFCCFSWHSFTEFSSSLIRCRSHSTVRLSTVNWFGCSLPTLSSIGLSSKRNMTGRDLYFSVKSLYSSAGVMLFSATSILRWMFVWSLVVKSLDDETSLNRFFLFFISLKLIYLKGFSINEIRSPCGDEMLLLCLLMFQ